MKPPRKKGLTLRGFVYNIVDGDPLPHCGLQPGD